MWALLVNMILRSGVPGPEQQNGSAFIIIINGLATEEKAGLWEGTVVSLSSCLEFLNTVTRQSRLL